MSTDTGEYAANAIEWARARLGDTDYATRCLAFVEDAIERSNGIEIFGGDYAAESALLYGSAENSGVPPLGALVFYDGVGDIMGTRRNWGHVGLSLGDGLVIHAWDRVRIDDHRAIAALTPAPGWEPLSPAGWTPLSRVLENSTPKSYGADDPADVAARMQIARFSGD
jgi:cell wall-associated NlpC family hydrolase